MQRNIQPKIDFIIELKDKLMKNKYPSINEDKVDKMIMDIRIFLAGCKEYETNQQFIGYKVLFRGFTIKI